MSLPTDHIDAATAQADHSRTLDDTELAASDLKRNKASDDGETVFSANAADERHLYDPTYPSPEQRATLRRIPGSINLLIFAIAFIEFAERFSYYGATVVFTNFIQQPLPEGSTTGSINGLAVDQTPGALGKGQQAAFGITTFNTCELFVVHLYT